MMGRENDSCRGWFDVSVGPLIVPNPAPLIVPNPAQSLLCNSRSAESWSAGWAHGGEQSVVSRVIVGGGVIHGSHTYPRDPQNFVSLIHSFIHSFICQPVSAALLPGFVLGTLIWMGGEVEPCDQRQRRDRSSRCGMERVGMEVRDPGWGRGGV